AAPDCAAGRHRPARRDRLLRLDAAGRRQARAVRQLHGRRPGARPGLSRRGAGGRGARGAGSAVQRRPLQRRGRRVRHGDGPPPRAGARDGRAGPRSRPGPAGEDHGRPHRCRSGPGDRGDAGVARVARPAEGRPGRRPRARHGGHGHRRADDRAAGLRRRAVRPAVPAADDRPPRGSPGDGQPPRAGHAPARHGHGQGRRGDAVGGDQAHAGGPVRPGGV
ncbi:MAG: hypothetical protein AVDCRST_MAG54-3151, partial [uncultured Actinomycetospora sp.]